MWGNFGSEVISALIFFCSIAKYLKKLWMDSENWARFGKFEIRTISQFYLSKTPLDNNNYFLGQAFVWVWSIKVQFPKTLIVTTKNQLWGMFVWSILVILVFRLFKFNEN